MDLFAHFMGEPLCGVAIMLRVAVRRLPVGGFATRGIL